MELPHIHNKRTKEIYMTTFIEATISGAGYTLGVTFTLLTIILLIMVINYDR